MSPITNVDWHHPIPLEPYGKIKHRRLNTFFPGGQISQPSTLELLLPQSLDSGKSLPSFSTSFLHSQTHTGL